MRASLINFEHWAYSYVYVERCRCISSRQKLFLFSVAGCLVNVEPYYLTIKQNERSFSELQATRMSGSIDFWIKILKIYYFSEFLNCIVSTIPWGAEFNIVLYFEWSKYIRYNFWLPLTAHYHIHTSHIFLIWNIKATQRMINQLFRENLKSFC